MANSTSIFEPPPSHHNEGHSRKPVKDDVCERLQEVGRRVKELEEMVQEGKPLSEIVYQLRSTVAGLRIAGEVLVEDAAQSDPKLKELIDIIRS